MKHDMNKSLAAKFDPKTKFNNSFDYLSEQIALDSGSSIDTFKNPDMVTDIRPAKEPMGMSTNAGTKKMTLQGTVPDHGKVWFDDSYIANIFSFSKMVDRGYRMGYDPDEDCFYATTPDRSNTVPFERNSDGLYTYQPTDEFFNFIAEQKGMKKPEKKQNNGISNAISTVAENRKGFTQRQFVNAKRARKLYHMVGCPTVESFKHMLRQRIIRNCPVTIDDVNNAEKIFGADIGATKGKTTRSKPKPVKEDWVEVPPEIIAQHHKLTLCMDVMYVNSMPMLTAIDKNIRFRSLITMENRTAAELYKCLDKIFRVYNSAGFLIKCIESDREFKTLMDDVKDDLDVTMNYPPAGAHVPEAERNNRTIGERIRSTYHNLPYKAIPKIMLQHLAMICADRLNWFPAKGGASPYYSPHVIMTHQDLDYEKHCQVPFGAYVQAYQENNPTNTNAPRTIDAVYLRPMKNKQGGHEVMNLATGRVVTAMKVFEKPVTDFVIKAVEAMAAEQNIKTLKLTGRNKQPLFPADWIAGVDYETESETEPETESEDDEEYTDDTDEDDDGDDLDDEDTYDTVDQAEIDELYAEPGQHQDTNPTDSNQNNDQAEADEADAPADNTVTDESSEDSESENTSRPQRTRKAPDRLSPSNFNQVKMKTIKFADDEFYKLEMRHNLTTQTKPDPDSSMEYDPNFAMVIARFITELNSRGTANGVSFGQQHILQKGLKIFGERGSAAALKEVKQLHDRICFSPIDVSDMTPTEKQKAMEALLFLTEKRDKSIKGRLVYNGKPTREWLSREDSASPTAALESIFLTAIVDAKEMRDVMSADVPNAFIQTVMPDVKDGEDRVIMKITGVLVDLLVQLAPEVYGPHVVYENGKKVLYVQVLRALYGMLVAALLWYRQFRKDLESQGFVFNVYDPCVANKMVNGKQHTVRFHVDDLMSSHVDSKVNDKFLKWLNKMYGGHGEVKATRGPIHDYLGMTFDFSEPGKVKVDMIDYMSAMVDEFPTKFKKNDTAPTPAPDDLFATGTKPELDKKRAEDFHTFVAKGLFACRRARPDIHTAIAALSTRVKKPNQDDWRKLLRLLKYVNGTRNDKLILSADDLHVIKWYVDASFAVHPDFKSHTGGGMTYGRGMPITMSKKQKLNTRSSTEAELVGADDHATMILWTKLFMEAQGYEIKKNILYQDNKSTILLEENGKRSSGKRTRAINIRYFFLTDQAEKGNLNIEYCPTTEMIGDHFTKPLQGKLFEKFKKLIMGH